MSAGSEFASSSSTTTSNISSSTSTTTATATATTTTTTTTTTTASSTHDPISPAPLPEGALLMKPIGFIRTPFKEKNGCPRQAAILATSRATLRIDLPGGESYLDGLSQFSHVHLLFHFHLNDESSHIRPKVRPPLLDGERVGVFATRSPHRPNPIGLTVAKITKIVKQTIYMNGVDLVCGTPIFDVKPYIGRYDSIPDSVSPGWIAQPPVRPLNVVIEEIADAQLKSLFVDDVFLDMKAPTTLKQMNGRRTKLEFYENYDELRAAIDDILSSDTRSIGQRQKHREGAPQREQIAHRADVTMPTYPTGFDRGSYGVCIDTINLRCRFDTTTEPHTIRVLFVEDWTHVF